MGKRILPIITHARLLWIQGTDALRSRRAGMGRSTGGAVRAGIKLWKMTEIIRSDSYLARGLKKNHYYMLIGRFDSCNLTYFLINFRSFPLGFETGLLSEDDEIKSSGSLCCFATYKGH
jgi:hypothetical protein